MAWEVAGRQASCNIVKTQSRELSRRNSQEISGALRIQPKLRGPLKQAFFCVSGGGGGGGGRVFTAKSENCRISKLRTI